MFCIKCGTEIIEGAEFCPSCGQPVINITPAQKEGAQPQQQQQFTQPPQFSQPQQQFTQSQQQSAQPQQQFAQPQQQFAQQPQQFTQPQQQFAQQPQQSAQPQQQSAQPQQQFTQPQQQFAQPQQQFAQPVQTYPGNYDPDPQSSQHRAIGIIATIVAALGVIFIWFMPCVTFKLGYAASEMFGINTKHSLITLGEAFDSPEGVLGFGIGFCILTLLPILEFTIPRKTGIKYLKKTRSGWISSIIIMGLSLFLEVYVGIGFSNTSSFNSLYEYNALFYIAVIFHVGILILSIIMTATISKLRNQQYNYLKSIDYDVKGI